MFIPSKDSSYIRAAPLIHVEGVFYVIGGETRSTSYSKTLARLDSISYEWSEAGDLITGRKGHNAIFDGSDIVVVGGYGTCKTQKCTIAENKVTCTEQDPSLVNYAYYPELFLIEEEYCKKMSSLSLFSFNSSFQ